MRCPFLLCHYSRASPFEPPWDRRSPNILREYADALAAMVNGLYKFEVIDYSKEGRTSGNAVELATLEWVDWFNKIRLHSAIGYVSLFEFEKRYCDSLILSGIAA